jgi:hypothetical protein
MEDYFRIAPGFEAVSPFQQDLPQGFEIIDLSVKHDGLRVVLIEDRLLAAFEVDNAQPPMSQADRSFEMEALPIGAAV